MAEGKTNPEQIQQWARSLKHWAKLLDRQSVAVAKLPDKEIRFLAEKSWKTIDSSVKRLLKNVGEGIANANLALDEDGEK